jgi:thioredoxin reductase
MNPSHDVPVLIAGAGPTGLTAALELSAFALSTAHPNAPSRRGHWASRPAP